VEFFHKKTSFPFMATRKVWYTLSAILMVVSFASFFFRGLNFAIDFTGGVAVEATFPKNVRTEAVRDAVVAAGFQEPQVSYLGSSRNVNISLQSTGQTAEQIRPLFLKALGAIDPGVQITQLGVVGAAGRR
jgi:preprotein translocase subunit SecF